MKIKWLGHSAFMLTLDSGTRIITDPYTTGDEYNLSYDEIKEHADIVTMSHDHFDHNNIAAVKGNPQVVKGTTEAKGIKFRGIPTYHDEAGGSKRGNNTIICFEVDGVKVCHLGDLGHLLSDKQVAEVGEVDVLLCPMAGFYTIDADTATQVCHQIKPRVTIPMHFKNARCDFPVTGVDEFIRGKKNVTLLDSSEVEFTPGELPTNTLLIMVLEPAL